MASSHKTQNTRNEIGYEYIQLHNTPYGYSLTRNPPIDLSVLRQHINALPLEGLPPSIKQAYRLKRRVGFRLAQAHKGQNQAVIQPLHQKFLAISLILELLLAKKLSTSHESVSTTKTLRQ